MCAVLYMHNYYIPLFLGKDLLKALENGVSQYPKNEGRFPLVIKHSVCCAKRFDYVRLRTYMYNMHALDTDILKFDSIQ